MAKTKSAEGKHVHGSNILIILITHNFLGENMKDYFLLIWKPKNHPTEPTKEAIREVGEIKRFFNIKEVWQYVLDNEIKFYSVHEADCIIDES